MKYQFTKEDAYRFASFVGAETKEKNDELTFKYCPSCMGGDHKDKETFSINLQSGAYCCHRSSCGISGHFVQLARDMKFPLDLDNMTRHYKKLPQKDLFTTDAAVRFLEKRGIPETITRKYNITTSSKDKNKLVFPFYNEHGKLEFVKLRDMNYKPGDKNKERPLKDTKPILFGMNHCSGFEQLIITEGQIDALSVASCGMNNVVSVPMGAKNFAWVAHCYNWVQQFKKIIVFGDCENGAVTLVDEIMKRFTVPVYVVRMQDYMGEKDANDILTTFGTDDVIRCVTNAEPAKIRNIVFLSEIKTKSLEQIDKVQTNIKLLDSALAGGFYFGDLVVITGRRGEGKSTFVSQLVCEFLEQDERIFLYSGELDAENVKRWLLFQLAGETGIETVPGSMYNSFKPGVEAQIDAWCGDRVCVFQNDYNGTEDESANLLQTIETAICSLGVRVVVVDNLMSAMENVTDENGLYQAQSGFVGKLKKIALKYSVLVLLVAHPRKNTGNNCDNDFIAGSGDVANKADVVLFYQRADVDTFDSLLSLTKNRHNGNLLKDGNAVKLIYNPMSKRIKPTENAMGVDYGWKHDSLATVDHGDFIEFLEE